MERGKFDWTLKGSAGDWVRWLERFAGARLPSSSTHLLLPPTSHQAVENYQAGTVPPSRLHC